MKAPNRTIITGSSSIVIVVPSGGHHTALSTAGFPALWHGQPQCLAEKGSIGATISLFLHVIALSLPRV